MTATASKDDGAECTVDKRQGDHVEVLPAHQPTIENAHPGVMIITSAVEARIHAVAPESIAMYFTCNE